MRHFSRLIATAAGFWVTVLCVYCILTASLSIPSHASTQLANNKQKSQAPEPWHLNHIQLIATAAGFCVTVLCVLYTHSFSQYTIPLYTVCTVYHASRFQVPSPRNIGHACCKIYTVTFILLLFVAVSVQLLWGWGVGMGD